MDYKSKIRKLLSLSTSSNVEEAKAALLKARQLMAEHKIYESDLDIQNQKIVEVETKYTANSRRDPWLSQLSACIAEHYCCRSIRIYKDHAQTFTICIVGFQEDAWLCTDIFGYAVDSIHSHTNTLKCNLAKTGLYTGKYITRECNSYGIGFLHGLATAYNIQNIEHPEWGLVLVTPSEISEYLKSYDIATDVLQKAQSDIQKNSYKDGYNDGLRFDPNHRVKETNRESLTHDLPDP